MLVNKGGGIVDLVVDDDVEILFCGMRRDVGVAEFLGHGVVREKQAICSRG